MINSAKRKSHKATKFNRAKRHHKADEPAKEGGDAAAKDGAAGAAPKKEAPSEPNEKYSL